MKKTTKRILFAAAAPFVLLIAAVGILVYRVTSDVKNMTPIETGELIPGIYAVKDSYVNLYLIKGKAGFIAIDSGANPENVRKELQKLNVNSADVAAVFLTHGDTDHTGGLSLFQNAKIYLANEEEQMIDGRTSRFIFFIKNKPIPKHDLLNDNQIVKTDGLKVAAILTPGHTPGSMCYLVGDQFLFTGDSTRLIDGKVDIFSKSINMDSGTQLQSLKKLARLQGVKYVFTGHFGYTDSFDRALKAFRN